MPLVLVAMKWTSNTEEELSVAQACNFYDLLCSKSYLRGSREDVAYSHLLLNTIPDTRIIGTMPGNIHALIQLQI